LDAFDSGRFYGDVDVCPLVSFAEAAMQGPLFQLVLSDGQQWSVEAEWPDGTLEKIGTFRHHSEAVNWLSTQSEFWLRDRND
jgi:hypothetical protein